MSGPINLKLTNLVIFPIRTNFLIDHSIPTRLQFRTQYVGNCRDATLSNSTNYVSLTEFFKALIGCINFQHMMYESISLSDQYIYSECAFIVSAGIRGWEANVERR